MFLVLSVHCIQIDFKFIVNLLNSTLGNYKFDLATESKLEQMTELKKNCFATIFTLKNAQLTILVLVFLFHRKSNLLYIVAKRKVL